MVLYPLPNGREWVLLNPLSFIIDDEGRAITVPARFVTDLVSRPWISALLVERWGNHGPWAILHDWLYWTRARTRSESDRLYLDGMAASGVSLAKRRMIWGALRVGGWLAWWRVSKRRAAGEQAFYLGQLPTIGEPMPEGWAEL
jgi:hypothetical protein